MHGLYKISSFSTTVPMGMGNIRVSTPLAHTSCTWQTSTSRTSKTSNMPRQKEEAETINCPTRIKKGFET